MQLISNPRERSGELEFLAKEETFVNFCVSDDFKTRLLGRASLFRLLRVQKYSLKSEHVFEAADQSVELESAAECFSSHYYPSKLELMTQSSGTSQAR